MVSQHDGSLATEFAARGPWITRFVIDGQPYGGTYDATVDPRVAGAVLRFAPLGGVLELGCLEGGHTVMLAPHASSVLGIDARPENLDRARWIRDLFGIPTERVEFMQANLEEWEPDPPEDFADTLISFGVLYHLADPIAALERWVTWAPRLALWTHVGAPGHRQSEAGWEDRLSGLHPDSPWPTREEVLAVLERAFPNVDVVPSNPGPPAVPLPSMLVYAWR